MDNLDYSLEISRGSYSCASGGSSKDVLQAREGRSVALLPAVPSGLWVGSRLRGGGGRCSPGSDVLGQRGFSIRSSL